MGMFVDILIPSVAKSKRPTGDIKYSKVLVGSVHKISKPHYPRIQELHSDNSYYGAILAGDQQPDICAGSGMNRVDSGKAGLPGSWPASCDKFGHIAGDIMCASNVFTKTAEKMLLPCSNVLPIGPSTLSDHAIYVANLISNGS